MKTILWRFIAHPGHEFCQLSRHGDEWHLQGTSVFTYDQRPCQLKYAIACDASWNTLFASVDGWVGTAKVYIQIRTDSNKHWWLNDVEVPETTGCTDLDLNFSPSTNTIPIQRLNLAIEEAAEIKAAWLKFPGFTLEPLEQHYLRIDEETFRYESGGGNFTAELHVNTAGFVTHYSGIWMAESEGK